MIKVYIAEKEPLKKLQNRVSIARNQFERLELAKKARANYLGTGVYKNYVKHKISVVNEDNSVQIFKITKKKVETINRFMNNVFSTKNYIKD